MGGVDQRLGTASAWLYRRFGQEDYRVGFYRPSGKWETVCWYLLMRNAAKRVHYLNGGN